MPESIAQQREVFRPADRLTERELGAWYGFLRAHAHLIATLDAELHEAEGISLSEYEALLFVRTAPGSRLRISELAERSLLSQNGISLLVDRLALAGLLRREDHDEDRRGAYAAITAKGRSMLRGANLVHLAGVRRRFLDRLSPEERRLLGPIWERLLGPEDA
jgi:DNA-binding MarR family transcriptional regulator